MENSEEVERQEVNEEVNKEQQEETKKVDIELWGLDDSFFEETNEVISTPKWHRTQTPHPSSYDRSYFYNSRPPALAPSETTMSSRPLRVFTVPIPQGYPVKKRLRVAIWID